MNLNSTNAILRTAEFRERLQKHIYDLALSLQPDQYYMKLVQNIDVDFMGYSANPFYDEDPLYYGYQDLLSFMKDHLFNAFLLTMSGHSPGSDFDYFNALKKKYKGIVEGKINERNDLFHKLCIEAIKACHEDHSKMMTMTEDHSKMMTMTEFGDW